MEASLIRLLLIFRVVTDFFFGVCCLLNIFNLSKLYFCGMQCAVFLDNSAKRKKCCFFSFKKDV